MAMASPLTLCGCLSMRIYDVKPAVAVADQKLAPAAVISYRHVTLDPHVVVDAHNAGPRVTKFMGIWAAAAQTFDRAFLDWDGDGPKFVANDPSAPYALSAEVVRVESGEDMDAWTQGKLTGTYVLFTLWNQPEKKVIERFTVNATEGGAWSVDDVGDTAVTKVSEYLQARFAGKPLSAE
jgi:hypothetical protein